MSNENSQQELYGLNTDAFMAILKDRLMNESDARYIVASKESFRSWLSMNIVAVLEDYQKSFNKVHELVLDNLYEFTSMLFYS